MLVIRRAQLEALRRSVRARFEQKMAVHLRTSFPKQTSDLTDAKLLELVCGQVDKAFGYDITSRYDVRRYLECAIVLGVDFDSAEATCWVGPILERSDVGSTQKMNTVCKATLWRVRRN